MLDRTDRLARTMERVLIIQDASREFCITSVRRVMRGLLLKRGDVLNVLGIGPAYTKKGCFPLLENKTKLHSMSTTINRHKAGAEEENQKTRKTYLNCPEYNEIMKIASTQQVEFEILVVAGSLKIVAVEYAKNFKATHVILHRQLKKETKYFTENLSCGISRMKSDGSIKIIRPPEEDEISNDPPGSDQETRENRTTAHAGPCCSSCKNRRPWIGRKREFTYAELQLATNGFCPQNLLQDHGRKIYIAFLNDQRKALIQEIPSLTIKEEQFRREVKVLEDVRHDNVAPFVGSCPEGPQRFLIYEYIGQDSLNKILSEKSAELTWERRISIALGAAQGIEYLHREKMYGGVKPSNILITHDYQPLISYYGLTMNQYEALGQSSDTTLRTFEFLAPEYQDTGIDLSKADVYSFGVVVLELITGRKTIHDTNGESFVRWARPLLKQRKYMELIDPVVQDVDDFQLYWLVTVVYKCINWEPESRCSMNMVVDALSRIINHSGVEGFSHSESEW